MDEEQGAFCWNNNYGTLDANHGRSLATYPDSMTLGPSETLKQTHRGVYMPTPFAVRVIFFLFR